MPKCYHSIGYCSIANSQTCVGHPGTLLRQHDRLEDCALRFEDLDYIENIENGLHREHHKKHFLLAESSCKLLMKKLKKSL